MSRFARFPPRRPAIAAALALLLLLGACAAPDPDPPRTIMDGAQVTLVDAIPGAEGPRPAVIVLHGATNDGAVMRHRLQMTERARQQGVVMVYPNASGTFWADGSLSRSLPGTPGDDMAMLDTLIARLVAEGVADPRAITLAGYSNGAMMAARYACERADRIAGLVMLGGTMPLDAAEACRPARPLAVRLLFGTGDPVMRWDGRLILAGVTLDRRLGVPDSFAFWQRANGCTGPIVESTLPLRVADEPPVRLEQARGCRDGVTTALFTIDGGGHRFPGHSNWTIHRITGPSTRNLDAAALLLEAAQPPLAPLLVAQAASAPRRAGRPATLAGR